MQLYSISPHLWHKALLFAKNNPHIAIADLARELHVSDKHAKGILNKLASVLSDRIIVFEPIKRGRPKKILQQIKINDAEQFAKLLAEAEVACISPQHHKEQAFLADKTIVNSQEVMQEFGVKIPTALRYLRRIVAQHPDEWRLIPISFGRGRPMLGIVRIPKATP